MMYLMCCAVGPLPDPKKPRTMHGTLIMKENVSFMVYNMFLIQIFLKCQNIHEDQDLPLRGLNFVSSYFRTCFDIFQ